MATKTLLFRMMLALSLLGSLVSLPGCPSDPAVPEVDSGGGDTGPRDGGGGDTGVLDSGAGDSGGSDTGALDSGGSDAGSCDPTDCDDMNPCNGVEVCEADNSCGPGTALADGATCDIDADPATRDLCVAGLCGPSRCGDSFTDTGEDCDDGNDVSGDGCDACVFSCTVAADCDDGNVCTGTESCGADHVCAAGAPPADGTSCGTPNICMGGFCVPPTCTVAADCDNALRCDGVETCTGTMCGAGTAPSCDDASPCTADSCSEMGAMCVNALIDGDGDGFAATALGACGTDCDDAVASTSPGAVEICGDGVDNDCDGMIDNAATTAYYADCDGDDYSVMGTAAVDSCGEPSPSLTGCTTGGAWTTRAPTTALDSDCNDENPAVSPGQMTYQTTAIAGEPVASDFDYNCNGTETRQSTGAGRCMRVGVGCLYTAGWQLGAGTSAPECGVDGTFIDGCSGMACTPLTSTRTQACL